MITVNNQSLRVATCVFILYFNIILSVLSFVLCLKSSLFNLFFLLFCVFISTLFNLFFLFFCIFTSTLFNPLFLLFCFFISSLFNLCFFCLGIFTILHSNIIQSFVLYHYSSLEHYSICPIIFSVSLFFWSLFCSVYLFVFLYFALFLYSICFIISSVSLFITTIFNMF
jgi:hypothetical protein